MLVQDAPVTTPYGWVLGYPLHTDPSMPGYGFHLGIDYGCPSGTQIIVNGVIIGLSGSTGASTGPHCHVGKWLGSQVYDPGVKNGFNFLNAQVIQIGEDAVNGKYVKLQADGFVWVYCHMSDNHKVTPGQILKGESVNNTPDRVKAVFSAYLFKEATQTDIDYWVQRPTTELDDSAASTRFAIDAATIADLQRQVAANNPAFTPYAGPQLFNKKEVK